MSKDAKFEVPPEMRALAEKSVSQAKQAFEGFLDAAQKAVSMAEGQATTAHTGAKEVGNLAMRFAEKNMASAFGFAQKLVQAKDVEELLKLQADYVRSQIEVLTEQAKDLGKAAARLGTGGKTH